MGACILIEPALRDKRTRLTVPESSVSMDAMILNYIPEVKKEKALGRNIWMLSFVRKH